MTCAKRQVRCVIVTPDKKYFYGTNACKNPQIQCPRLPGENYKKCHTICQQDNHAELVALQNAEGVDLTGSTAHLRGHEYYCHDCQKTLFKAGVKYLERPDNYD